MNEPPACRMRVGPHRHQLQVAARVPRRSAPGRRRAGAGAPPPRCRSLGRPAGPLRAPTPRRAFLYGAHHSSLSKRSTKVSASARFSSRGAKLMDLGGVVQLAREVALEVPRPRSAPWRSPRPRGERLLTGHAQVGEDARTGERDHRESDRRGPGGSPSEPRRRCRARGRCRGQLPGPREGALAEQVLTHVLTVSRSVSAGSRGEKPARGRPCRRRGTRSTAPCRRSRGSTGTLRPSLP